MSTPEPLWSDERIIDSVVSTGLSYTVAIQVRDDYEAERAATRARLAELEAELAEAQGERDAALFALMQHNPDALAGDLVGWVADAKRRLAEALVVIAKPKRSGEGSETGIRGGLLKGRIRLKGVREPSMVRPTFDAALQMATTADLMWALNLLIKHPNARRTWRDYRIKHIDKRLREIMAAMKGAQP